MILGPNGRPVDEQQTAPLLAPNGEPVVSTPAPAPQELRVLTDEDLRDFLNRLGVRAGGMSQHNPNLALFNEAASWIVTMAKQIAGMQQQEQALRHAIAELRRHVEVAPVRPLIQEPV